MAKDFERIYKNFGINVEPVGDNYNPETYGRELMRELYSSDGVMYSSSTNYVQEASSIELEKQKVAYA